MTLYNMKYVRLKCTEKKKKYCIFFVLKKQMKNFTSGSLDCFAKKRKLSKEN